MRTNSSLTLPTLQSSVSPTSSSFMADEEEYSVMEHDDTGNTNNLCYFEKNLKLIATVSFICVVCICGLVGNGAVIWLLGFRMKRNPFTTYILNLAVADFGVLISIPITHVVLCSVSDPFDNIINITAADSLIEFTYTVSQFLLTSISIDRCVSVLFPLWHRCHRPKNLSTILCALIWVLSFLLHGIFFIAFLLGFPSPSHYVLLANAMFCFPLISTSSLILLSRVCFKAQMRRRGKLLIVILLTLIFFLTLGLPMNVIIFLNVSGWNSADRNTIFNPYYLILCGYLCTALNSFVNPLIYFLVGRKKKGLCRENMKLILQRVFMEDEVHGEEQET